MIIIPVITFVVAVALLIIFECAWTWTDKHWVTPMGRGTWCIVYWSLISVVLLCCRIMPFAAPELFKWTPYILVGVIHILMCDTGGGFYRIPPPNPRGSGPSNNQKSQDDQSGTDEIKQMEDKTWTP